VLHGPEGHLLAREVLQDAPLHQTAGGESKTHALREGIITASRPRAKPLQEFVHEA